MQATWQRVLKFQTFKQIMISKNKIDLLGYVQPKVLLELGSVCLQKGAIFLEEECSSAFLDFMILS
jgi:hypothetical protein